jgi:hypothetical protein
VPPRRGLLQRAIDALLEGAARALGAVESVAPPTPPPEQPAAPERRTAPSRPARRGRRVRRPFRRRARDRQRIAELEARIAELESRPPATVAPTTPRPRREPPPTPAERRESEGGALPPNNPAAQVFGSKRAGVFRTRRAAWADALAKGIPPAYVAVVREGDGWNVYVLDGSPVARRTRGVSHGPHRSPQQSAAYLQEKLMREIDKNWRIR